VLDETDIWLDLPAAGFAKAEARGSHHKRQVVALLGAFGLLQNSSRVGDRGRECNGRGAAVFGGNALFDTLDHPGMRRRERHRGSPVRKYVAGGERNTDRRHSVDVIVGSFSKAMLWEGFLRHMITVRRSVDVGLVVVDSLSPVILDDGLGQLEFVDYLLAVRVPRIVEEILGEGGFVRLQDGHPPSVSAS